jgi:hypothetical protein
MKQIYTPKGFKTPLFPLWPAVGVLVTMFLIGTLGPAAWERWAYVLAAGLVFYYVFGIIDARIQRTELEAKAGDLGTAANTANTWPPRSADDDAAVAVEAGQPGRLTRGQA